MPTIDIERDYRGQRLTFAFPEIHPAAKLSIVFNQTLRIPDDGKQHALPPGLGTFPIKKLDDYLDRVPAKWVPQGGVMVPMYQAEALWMGFHADTDHERGVNYPFAIRVAAGMRSAVTGEEFNTESGLGRAGEKQDYLVHPGQPYLDGFVVEEGVIKQFIAAVLGEGYTAEGQLSGEEKFGGIQFQVFPMKREVFEAKYPVRPPTRIGERRMRSAGGGGMKGMTLGGGGGAYESMGGGAESYSYGAGAASASINNVSEEGVMRSLSAMPKAEMGLGVGGQMKQEVYKDDHGVEAWDTNGARTFVHLANSLAWKIITRESPPPSPATARAYRSAGYTWFDHYNKDADVLGGTALTKSLQSVLELGFQKVLAGGEGMLPDNGIGELPGQKPVQLGDKRPPSAPEGQSGIRDGKW